MPAEQAVAVAHIGNKAFAFVTCHRFSRVMAVTKTTRKSPIILAFVLVLVLTAVVSGGVVVLEQSWNISTAASHRLEVLVQLLSITAYQDHTSRGSISCSFPCSSRSSSR